MKFPLLFALLTFTLPPAFAAAIPVRVATVEQTPHAAERQIPGRIEAIHTVELRARTEGVITKINFRDGQYVKKGDVLFELDDAEPRAAVRLAQAEVTSAEATLRQAQQQLSRFESLGNNNAISRHDVDNARMQRDVARAALEQAKARLETRNVTLGYTRITSPIAGRVGHSNFHVGSLVNPASGVLVDVVQLDPIRIAFALEEGTFAAKVGKHTDLRTMKQAWQALIDSNLPAHRRRADVGGQPHRPAHRQRDAARRIRQSTPSAAARRQCECFSAARQRNAGYDAARRCRTAE